MAVAVPQPVTPASRIHLPEGPTPKLKGEKDGIQLRCRFCAAECNAVDWKNGKCYDCRAEDAIAQDAADYARVYRRFKRLEASGGPRRAKESGEQLFRLRNRMLRTLIKLYDGRAKKKEMVEKLLREAVESAVSGKLLLSDRALMEMAK